MDTFLMGILAVVIIVGSLCNSKGLMIALRIKYLEMSITRHSRLLKNSSDADEVRKLDSRLLALFVVYEHKIARPVSLVRLFPGSKPSTQNELTEYELEMKLKLVYYYTLHQNIVIYNDGWITLTELIKRI